MFINILLLITDLLITFCPHKYMRNLIIMLSIIPIYLLLILITYLHLNVPCILIHVIIIVFHKFGCRSSFTSPAPTPTKLLLWRPTNSLTHCCVIIEHTIHLFTCSHCFHQVFATNFKYNIVFTINLFFLFFFFFIFLSLSLSLSLSLACTHTQTLNNSYIKCDLCI